MTNIVFTEIAIEAVRQDAIDWLTHTEVGSPRSWKGVEAQLARFEDYYDAENAPTIVGYEALEREGYVRRTETILNGERLSFELTPLGYEKIRGAKS